MEGVEDGPLGLVRDVGHQLREEDGPGAGEEAEHGGGHRGEVAGGQARPQQPPAAAVQRDVESEAEVGSPGQTRLGNIQLSRSR